VIPARGGSKGLPGKNIRPCAGLPLIAHTILFSRLCQEITRTIVTTDSNEIATIANRHGADVPFLRPAELALDTTPMWSVLRHALETVEQSEHQRFDYLLLLDPTTPCRQIAYVSESFQRLQSRPDADGVIGVSEPDFNPIWMCVKEGEKGLMSDLFSEASQFNCRQHLPKVLRINGSIYLWRADFVRNQTHGWRKEGKHIMYVTPDSSAISIDNEDEFRRVELLIHAGIVRLPWLSSLPGKQSIPAAT
jgi:CMP-N,N'-diacetyllegionaminic acid synthase